MNLKPKKYYKDALKRAKRRKSPVNLILILPAFVLLFVNWYALFLLMWKIHLFFYPNHTGQLSEFWQEGISLKAFASSFLLTMPLFFAALLISFILSNFIIWSVPRLRDTLQKEAKNANAADFERSMQTLLKVGYIVIPISLLLSFIGAITLKSLT